MRSRVQITVGTVGYGGVGSITVALTGVRETAARSCADSEDSECTQGFREAHGQGKWVV